MKRWIILLCLLGLVITSPSAQAYNIAGSVSGGNSGLLLLKYVIAIPLRLDTANLLSNFTIVNPLNGHYTLSNLDSGMYILFSYQDLNHNILPDLDEPRGFWSTDSSGLPTIMNLISDTAAIHIQLSPPNSGGFTGRLSYAGSQRGITYVFAYYTASFDTSHGTGILLDTARTGNGNYTALTDTFRTYYAYAFMDLNNNFQHDADEPYGVYGGSTPAQIHVQQTHFPDSINIVMEDPNTAGEPPRQLPQSLSLKSVYPNPFNSSTTVAFNVATADRIELSLYDVLGRQVAVLTRGTLAPGEHRINFDGSGISTGVYFLHLSSSHSMVTRAVILLK